MTNMPGSVARIGVLGCADIASRKLIPALKRCDRVNLVAVASRTKEKAEHFGTMFDCAAVTGYAALLERPDIDAVYIPLPPALHATWAARALQAGKHVLVEKPAVRSAADASWLVELARSHELVLMENFMFLCHRRLAAVRGLLDKGTIGKPRVFSAVFGFPPLPSSNFRYSRQLGGGALLDAGCYTLRAAAYFLGPELDVIGACVRHEPTSGVDLGGTALLCGSSGAMAELAWGMDRHYQCTYAIWGSEGRLLVDRAFTAPADYRSTIRIAHGGTEEEIRLPPDDQVANLVEEFVDAVLQGHDRDRHYAEIHQQAVLLQDVRDGARHIVAPATQDIRR